MNATSIPNRPAPPRAPLKIRFYRQCRIWHGYLSAFAFAALLFFSATGLVLNHPDWFASESAPVEESEFQLTAQQLEEMRSSSTPAEVLARIAADHATLHGEYQDGTVAGDQVVVILRGVRGSSDITANLTDGSVVVASEGTAAISQLNALHRGESAGAVWRFSLDIMAIVMIVVALAGYAIFLSMGAKLRTALLITGSSILTAIVLFFAFVK